SQQTSKPLYFHYVDSHKDLLNLIINDKIDFAYLGPVPYLLLTSKYKHVEPLAEVLEKDGKPTYRCVLFIASDKEKVTIKKLALTNPISTCGYVSMKYLLKKRKIDIDKIEYQYLNNHEEVLKQVLAGFYDAGGVKEDIYLKYRDLGAKAIEYTDEYPAFVIIANKKTVKDKDIENIKKLLLESPKETFTQLKIGGNGFTKFDDQRYSLLKKMLTPDILRKIYD
ncbi:MAG: PhnD/SsuA/transferrin family substrate-binding protein, partial [Calditerrivibrio sp.]|nr:PhnD/SsuA/transferrin family substrate-binding protein [Calditerrivibrio sp.]